MRDECVWESVSCGLGSGENSGSAKARFHWRAEGVRAHRRRSIIFCMNDGEIVKMLCADHFAEGMVVW
jgi:hypothetical protein